MSRTFRLRHLPKINAKKYVDSNVHFAQRKEDFTLEEEIAHQIFHLPCSRPIGTHNRKNDHERSCLYDNTTGLACWIVVTNLRRHYPHSVANKASHHYVGYSVISKSRVRREVRTGLNRAERRVVKALMLEVKRGQDDAVCPVVRKEVSWLMS